MRARERTKTLEKAIHRLCFARSVLMDADHVRLLLDGLQRWSDAHGDRNGERGPRDIRRAIDASIAHLAQIMDETPSAHTRLERAAATTRPDPLDHDQVSGSPKHRTAAAKASDTRQNG